MIALALGASFARRLGYIDQEMVIRLVIGINGIWIAWYGNRMPKTFLPNAGARRARRVASWAMVLSGLVYVGLFAFAPIQVAIIGGCGAVAAGMLVTLGYCLAPRSNAEAA
ncbi:ammonium transporter [Sphingomonas gei]|uniref:Ammonium transporter n=1 Tax=Sphingomonas gei TaxID=1395960 RepID=A0A4S1XDB9_9SPHN|nr:ammonium transporter [Sphingomonas gei]